MICVPVNSLCIFFVFEQSTTTWINLWHKLVTLEPYDHKYFNLETTNACIFSSINCKWKILSAAGQTKLKPSRKPQTLNLLGGASTHLKKLNNLGLSEEGLKNLIYQELHNLLNSDPVLSIQKKYFSTRL